MDCHDPVVNSALIVVPLSETDLPAAALPMSPRPTTTTTTTPRIKQQMRLQETLIKLIEQIPRLLRRHIQNLTQRRPRTQRLRRRPGLGSAPRERVGTPTPTFPTTVP